MPNPPRIYADTSVFGGVFDDEFCEASRKFFDSVRSGRIILVVSTIVQDEVVASPPAVVRFFDEARKQAQIVDVVDDAVRLQIAYMEAGIVSPKMAADALHVALATTHNCDAIARWNFRHIVNER